MRGGNRQDRTPHCIDVCKIRLQNSRGGHDEDLVARLSSGDFSLKDEPGLGDVFRQVVDDGLFRVTTSLEDGVSCSDIIVLSLPTPITGDKIPDYSALKTVGRQLGVLARIDSIIVVESTIEPGFLENEFLGLVEGGKTKVKAGVSVGMGVCPEAANLGEILRDFARLPSMVGATDGETQEDYKSLQTRISGGL